MSPAIHHDLSKSWSSAILRWVVHIDALRLAPGQYARCLWWWITGKRLRAKMRLAPLLARSPRAYALWQSRQPTASESRPAVPEDAPLIRALVAAGAEVQATLASLEREGIDAKVVSAPNDFAAPDAFACDWILPMSCGDVLARGAGAQYRAAAAEASDSTHVIYADDDLINSLGHRHAPHMKPDWNSELYGYFDYVTGSAILRVTDRNTAPENDDDWAAALTRQALEQDKQALTEPLHLRRILHHRRKRPSPMRPSEPAKPATSDEKLPSVSIIIPTRNRVDLLRTCLEGLARTQYPINPEIIVIDNGSDDPETLAYLAKLKHDFAQVTRDDTAFNFAALNNRAAQHASGDLLCFLNNDIEVRDPLWLVTMARQAMREEIGAVGARLLYPDGLIQHAGVVVGIGGAAAHAHRLLQPDEQGYFHRHSIPQFVTAVTAACMVVRRDRFEEVGGFDAGRFAISFNDVDLCMRLRANGWRSLYEPRATLVHHESVSRGLDRDAVGAARQAREVAALQEAWQTGLAQPGKRGERRAADPFHHPELSPLSEQFVLRL